jgi:hypothetical protein
MKKAKCLLIILILSLLNNFAFATEVKTSNLDSLVKANLQRQILKDSPSVFNNKKAKEGKFEPLAIIGALASVASLFLVFLMANLGLNLSFPLLLILTTLIISIAALLKIRKNKRRGKGLAIFGIVFSILPYVLIVLIAILALRNFS